MVKASLFVAKRSPLVRQLTILPDEIQVDGDQVKFPANWIVKRQKAESDGILSIKKCERKQQWQQLTTTIQATAVGILDSPKVKPTKWLQLSTIFKESRNRSYFIH